MIFEAGHIHSAADARRIAKRRLPWMVFDYIDGAAGAETGAARNRSALDATVLRTRILRDVSQRDMTAHIFGTAADRPAPEFWEELACGETRLRCYIGPAKECWTAGDRAAPSRPSQSS